MQWISPWLWLLTLSRRLTTHLPLPKPNNWTCHLHLILFTFCYPWNNHQKYTRRREWRTKLHTKVNPVSTTLLQDSLQNSQKSVNPTTTTKNTRRPRVFLVNRVDREGPPMTKTEIKIEIICEPMTLSTVYTFQIAHILCTYLHTVSVRYI